MESGPVAGRFVERLEWLSVKGDRAVFHEVRTVTVPARRTARLVLDVDTTITCGDAPATWNATPYHLLAIRVPDEMLVGRGGAILNSEGKRDRDVDDQPARWLDYSGPLHGKTAGVALFDHPGNLRHPTRWLNFENQTIGAAPTHHEAYAWQPGKSLRFRYRVLVHGGDAKHAAVEQECQAYAADVKARVGPPRRVA